MKEQTIREYAKSAEIPLRQILQDLKQLGFSTCGADDIFDKHMLKVFRGFYRKTHEARRIETEAKALERAKAIKESREKEALLYAEHKATEVFSKSSDNLKKLGQIIDLCLELLPEKVNSSLSLAIQNKSFSVFILENCYDFLKAFHFAKSLKDSDKKLPELYFDRKIIPEWMIIEYQLTNLNDGYRFDLEKSIHKRRKNKLYSSALLEVLYFILTITGKYGKSKDISIEGSYTFRLYEYKAFSLIGELLIDMGAMQSALKLYSIDQYIFNDPNLLGQLADGAIKLGAIEESPKLLAKLMEQEPFHPAIPYLKAEVKRLEQRQRLKSNFSIDFSKIDELSGLEFENLLMDKFLSMGFKVESTPKTGDFGADLIIENNEGTRIIVQCKRFKSKVNLKAVQEVVGAMGHYSGDMGVVITNNSFLNSAVKLAESHDIELWDGDKLVSFLAGDLSFSEINGSSS
ncbi:MAG: restriction endonuclease [Candidatus Methylumidiphilus sp.]